MKITSVVSVIVATVGLLASGEGLAVAQPAEGLVDGPVKHVRTALVPECVDAVKKASATGLDVSAVDCSITTISKASEARRVSADEVRLDKSLSKGKRESLLQAVAAGAVYSKHFSWFTTAGVYTVTHNGTFYYNGWKAWVGEFYDGYQGYHSCFVNYSSVVTISNQDCAEAGTTFERDLLYRWQVIWPWGPPYFGLTYSVENWGSVYGNGTMS